MKVEQILSDLTYPKITWEQRCLVAIFGFPGAGKTVIASYLSNRYPFICLTTDFIRLKYGFANGRATLESLFGVAEKLLIENRSVIFDGIHMMQKNREEVRQFGSKNNAHVRFIHVVADDAVLKHRLQQRIDDPTLTAQERKFVITPEHFQRIISYYERPEGEQDVTEVDTTSLVSENQLSSLYAELNTWLGNIQK